MLGNTCGAVMDASISVAGFLSFGLSIVSNHRCQPLSGSRHSQHML